uniref:Cilia and flagella associated protein 119 n=1 Tax=Oncorhynchus kisutch TaxID=8019 RepID=A0A8C7H8S6_ONCKI
MEEIENTKAIPELERSLSLFVATHTKSRTLWLTGYFLLRTLCCVLGVNIPEPRRRVLLELYVHTVLFCRESNFNREQTSVLLSIVKKTPLNNMGHCYAYCSELLLCHSVRVSFCIRRVLCFGHFHGQTLTFHHYSIVFYLPQRPPFSISLFSSEDVTQILKYLLNTYFRHYNLYKYIFTPQRNCVVTSLVLNIDTSVATCEISYPSPKSELRTIIQQEMREEMIHMSRQLEQRLKESADRLNSALTSLETNLQGKK